jgi:hypothetical protein
MHAMMWSDPVEHEYLLPNTVRRENDCIIHDSHWTCQSLT